MFLLMSTLLKMFRLKKLNPLIVNLITLQNYFMFVKLFRNLLSIHNTIQTFVHPFFRKIFITFWSINILFDFYIDLNSIFLEIIITPLFCCFRKENIALNSCFQYYRSIQVLFVQVNLIKVASLCRNQ